MLIDRFYTPATQGQIRTEVSTQSSCPAEHSGGCLKLFVPFCSNMMKVNEMVSQENSGSFYTLPSIPPFRDSFRKHLEIVFWTKTAEIKNFFVYVLSFSVQLSPQCGGCIAVRIKLLGWLSCWRYQFLLWRSFSVSFRGNLWRLIFRFYTIICLVPAACWVVRMLESIFVVISDVHFTLASLADFVAYSARSPICWVLGWSYRWCVIL